jgi:DNA sulfur modification protein DndE
LIIASSTPSTDAEIIKTAREAYIYGYPLVLMEISKRVMTNFEKSTSSGAPLNQIARKEEFPDDKFTAVVKPNTDTYYALAWLDLSDEPLVLEIPNTQGRYYLLPILDAWTNVIASPGKRTTGNDAQRYLISGPTWNGKVLPDMKQIPSPTCMAWLVCRTQVNSREDGMVVKKIQDGYRLTPLSSYGKIYNPRVLKVDTSISKKAPVRQVHEMFVEVYFNMLNHLMIRNPPFAADSLVLSRIAPLGIAPGSTFDVSKFTPAVQDSLKTLPFWFKKYIIDLSMKKQRINGWVINRGLGDYGINYDLRAMIAHRGLGANLDADAIYPSSMVDADGEKYDGSRHNYALHFDEGNFPPANAFWSLTMYNMDNFLIANAINRFSIGDRNDLKQNPDGSLDIFIQKDNPGKEKASNWLPAAGGPFNLTLRIYWPKDDVLNGVWIPPAVKKAK